MKQNKYNFDWQENTGYTDLSTENKSRSITLNASIGNAPKAVDIKSDIEIQQLN